MTISIIIPTLNEEKHIGRLLDYLFRHGQENLAEIIVADGGSCDGTPEIAASHGAKVVTSPKGRAVQMNYGASFATGDILYFIHADTLPPTSYIDDILNAIQDGFDFGRYRTRFNGSNLLLKVNAFFTRFDLFVCHGGDQTFFIKKTLFTSLKGYDESLMIMEEYDLTVRAKNQGRYKIMSKASLVSTRKYEDNSWWQVQKANFTVVKLYRQGVAQDILLKRYNEMIHYTGKR